MMRLDLLLVKLLVKTSPVKFLIASAGEIGWGIAIDDEDPVTGFVLGTDEFIGRHTNIESEDQEDMG